MDDINFITSLEKMKGLSLRAIAKESGHDFRTVKKYIDKRDWNMEAPKRNQRGSLLDPVKPIIDEWLQADIIAPRKQRHTAKRVYERLKTEHADKLKVSLRIVQLYVAAKKKELHSRDENGYIPLSHSPGEAQADFGEVVFYENGIETKGYYFTLCYPYSNAAYCQIYRGQNQECLLEGMKSIFEHTEKVPTEIWFDNLSAAVVTIGKNRGRTLVEQFERFSLHYGFIHNFCNPYSGNEKGAVECKVGYERRNFFVPVPSISSLCEYNKEILEMCTQDMNREHYRKEELIANLFEDDKKAMRFLPEKEFEVCRLIKVKANKYGKVQHDTYIYSGSPSVALQQVWVKLTANEVTLLTNEYEHIVTHPRLYGSKKESMLWGPYLSLMSRRPNAIKYTDFYRELPDTWQQYLDSCNDIDKRKGLNALALMLKENGIEVATNALSSTIHAGVKDADSILASYTRIVNPHTEASEIILADYVPRVEAYKPDISIYDSLYIRRCMA